MHGTFRKPTTSDRVCTHDVRQVRRSALLIADESRPGAPSGLRPRGRGVTRRPDLLDHLAPFATPNASGALACLAVALTIAASLWRLAALAPVAP